MLETCPRCGEPLVVLITRIEYATYSTEPVRILSVRWETGGPCEEYCCNSCRAPLSDEQGREFRRRERERA